MIGYETYGSGPTKVVLLHDWLGDRTTYEPARTYLDGTRFTFVLPDLRGYGLSRHLDGFSLETAVADLTRLVDTLGFDGFAVAGHSMSGMVALRLALDCPERVRKVVLTAPVTAEGVVLDEGGKAFFQAVAVDQGACRDIVAAVTGHRYDATWLDYKARRSRETSTQAARSGYLQQMLLAGGFADDLASYRTPTLVITGEHDTDGFREADVKAKLSRAPASVAYKTIGEAGHYPMQEAPVRFASVLQAFLA